MASNILRKMETILRLTKSENAGEAASAAARIKEMADKYNIAVEILKERGHEEYNDNIVDYMKRYGRPFREDLLPWEMILSKIISDHNGCRVFLVEIEGKDQLNIVGMSKDIEMVDLLYSWLRVQLSSLIVNHIRDLGPTLKEPFTLGMIHKVSEKMEARAKEVRASLRESIPEVAFAIKKLDQRLDVIDKFLSFKSFERNTIDTGDKEAWAKGYQAAKDVEIEQKMELP